MPLAVMNWHSFFFLFFALITCGFALAVLFTNNIVRMAFYLTICLGAASGLFFLAGSEFIGAMQFMIYVGGTLVLLIFGVMLTAHQRFITMETSAAEWILAAVVGSALLLLLVQSGFAVKDWQDTRKTAVSIPDTKTSTKLGLALSGVRVDKLDQPDATLREGMSGYLLPFVIISMHLLVVLIGAGYMARSKRRAPVGAVRTAVVHDRRRFSFFVHAGLVKGMVINAILAVLCFSGIAARYGVPPGSENFANATVIQKGLGYVASLPPWVLPTLGILFAINVLLMYVVYSWQKWAVIGLVIVPVIQAWCLHSAVNGLHPMPAPVVVPLVFLAVTLLPVLLLIGLITTGRPSAWSQME